MLYNKLFIYIVCEKRWILHHISINLAIEDIVQYGHQLIQISANYKSKPEICLTMTSPK